ncbi:MAG: Gfo/Idh/MocA family oxidoreductase [Lachnospiraceae bacterium]|nr:Gfo/Idh/MocA family oxidoreductase [Lachnospiraceae bacterium]
MQRKVKLGVIGAGAFSDYHLDGIRLADNCEAIAVCDVDLEKAKRQAEKYKIDSVYQDYHELLAREDIEAVTLPLPDQVHKQITLDALRAGKHVLCEKPMALSLEDCKEMIDAAKETGKLLMVGQIGRYTPCFNKAIDMVNSGEIGELFFVESEYAHDYAPIGGAGGWRVTPERHPVLGGGCHAVDLLRRIAGNPEEVFAYANHKVLKDWPVEDCTVAVMKFPNNVIGKVMCSIGCKRKYTMRTVIYGSKGTLIVDSKLPYITLYRDHFSDEEHLKNRWQQEIGMEIQVPIDDHNFRGEVTDFCNAIIEGHLVECTGEEGAVTVAACLAIVESARKGEKVEIKYDL